MKKEKDLTISRQKMFDCVLSYNERVNMNCFKRSGSFIFPSKKRGAGVCIADFFCNTLMLAIELDGYTHGFENVFERDRKK